MSTDYNSAAIQAYNLFNKWNNTYAPLQDDYAYIQDTVDQLTQQNEQDYEYGRKDQTIYEENQRRIRNWKVQQELVYSQHAELINPYDVTHDGTVEEFTTESLMNSGLSQLEQNAIIGYGLLAQGHLIAADKDGDNLLSFSEFLNEELRTLDDFSFVLNDDISQDDVRTALENGEDISQYIKEEYLKGIQKTYNAIDYPEEETDGLSYDELVDYYSAIDAEDGKQDGQIAPALNVNDVTINLDKFNKENDSNIDCPSRLITSLYGVSFYSEEGQKIWNELKELNPGMDEDHFYAGATLTLYKA